MIRDTVEKDMEAILGMVEASGQFDADSRAHVQETLERHFSGYSRDIWLTADDGEPVGVAYCAAEPVAAGAWNLQMLWTRADRQRLGHGASLVQQVERALRQRSARLLIVETSSLPAFVAARAFYARYGFVHEASIRNYFSAGDDKLVFTKPLPAGSA